MKSRLQYLLVFLLLAFSFLFRVTVAYAEVQQNILVNCLDYYIRPDAPEGAGLPAWAGQPGHAYLHGANIMYNGVSHIIMLKNKTGSLFSVGKPIYVMRNNTTGYAGNPAGHEAFCAVDQTNSALCTADTMQPNGIKISSNYFKIVDQTQPIMPDAAGNLTLPHVKSYTPLWDGDQGDTAFFYGVQMLAATGGAQTEALGAALKLGTFTPTGTIPSTTTNCVSIYWDPAGKVIDAKTLEPVLGTTVTLYTLEDNGQRTQTQEPGNPFFVNPYTTDAGGNFTFAVQPGTYAFNVNKTGFTFPIDAATLQQAAIQLNQLDPNHEYVDSTKLYNNTQEPVIETAGTIQ